MLINCHLMISFIQFNRLQSNIIRPSSILLIILSIMKPLHIQTRFFKTLIAILLLCHVSSQDSRGLNGVIDGPGGAIALSTTAENLSTAVDNINKLLHIPTRLQWQNGLGYCGQTSIQSISLYYGSYISQNQVRKIAESQVLVGQNAQQTLEKLSYRYEVWNNKHPKPQYKDFLQWIKKNIKNGYPVIITGYEPKGSSQEYDHIYLALGVQSENLDQYSDDDILIYADLFSQDYTQTPFGLVWDTRSMKGNGKSLDFAIPRDIDYGIAVKGIIDTHGVFLPVRIVLRENSEPNVSVGQQSVEFKYKVTASGLTSGKIYAILRYDSYEQIPKDLIQAAQASNVIQFQAEGTQYSFDDTVESSKMVFYRCIEERRLE